jgi:poly(3-hydroxyalkanoate) synthetase
MTFSGGQVAARTPGEGLSVIEDAPGSYVRVRSDA